VRLLVRWLAERGGLIAVLLLLAVIAFILWQQRR
jgi:cbb3-type cytochrome oxidase subunit 3